jgi:hypothetical protein
MPIDPRIAMGFQPTTQLESPLNRLAKFQQLESGQRANELARMQMQEYQRGLQEQEGLRNYLAGSPDLASPKGQSELMRYGKPGIDFAESMAKKAKTEAETKAAQFKHQQEIYAHGIQTIGAAKNGADVIAALDDGVKRGYFSQEQADAKKAELAALQTMPQLQQWQQKKLQGLMDAKSQLEMSMPKPGPKTDLAKLIEERNRFQPGTSEYNLYTQAITKATTHTPSTQVNVGGAVLEKKEQQAKGELNVKGYEDVANVARMAARTLPALETQEMLLNKGFETGFGADAQKAGASILSALGVKDAEKFAANAESFNAAASQAVLAKQIEQKGPQTEADASRISRTGAELGNTVAGNRFIISIAKAQAKKDIQQRNFYDSWWKNNKTYEGVEDAWYAGEGGKSLFERPELKKYIEQPNTGVPLPSAGGARPTSAAPSSPLPKSPQGIDPAIWAVMTPEERALWK